MSTAAPASFWAIAILGSVALHGAVGMGLYAMPMPEPKKPAHTEITISAPEAGARVQQAEAETIAARTAQEASVIEPPASPELVANDTTERAERHVPAAIEAPIATDAGEAKPAPPPDLAPSNPVAEAVAAATQTELANRAESRDVPVGVVSDAAMPVAEPETAIAPASEPAQSDIVVASLSEIAEPANNRESLAVEPTPAVEPTTTADPIPLAITPADGGPNAVVGAAARLSTNPATTALVPTRPIAIAPTASVDDTPETVAVSQATSGAEIAASPVLPEAAATRPVEDEPVVAMLRPQNIAPDDLDVPDSSGMRIEDFLSESEGADCLLALPLDPMQASVEAYAATPEAVHELGAEFMRMAGLDLKTEMRPVSKAQCGALNFARSLAQYPNFPLHIALNQPEIASGTDLSGVVSGLRKDTLYLMVVDDDGKAKLVSSSTVGDVRSMEFSAAMTLTSRPGSAVQLLVAIAADGPLKNLPTKLGKPASEYFSRLTFEIIGDNRSIAYGITSFVVR